MKLGRRRLVLLGAVVLAVAACTGDLVEPATSVETVATTTSTSTTVRGTTSTSSTSTSTPTSTTLAIETFDPQVIGSYVFAPVDWGIIVGFAGPGVHLVHMVVEVRPAVEGGTEYLEQIEHPTGRLVWDETGVDLCRVQDRTEGDPRLEGLSEQRRTEFRWIGDIFLTDEWCPDWTPDFGAMQNAFEEFGLPEQGCVTFTFDGLTHELCEPLNELPATYQWNPDWA